MDSYNRAVRAAEDWALDHGPMYAERRAAAIAARARAEKEARAARRAVCGPYWPIEAVGAALVGQAEAYMEAEGRKAREIERGAMYRRDTPIGLTYLRRAHEAREAALWLVERYAGWAGCPDPAEAREAAARWRGYLDTEAAEIAAAAERIAGARREIAQAAR
jgi:hypothetical protein